MVSRGGYVGVVRRGGVCACQWGKVWEEVYGYATYHLTLF